MSGGINRITARVAVKRFESDLAWVVIAVFFGFKDNIKKDWAQKTTLSIWASNYFEVLRFSFFE